MNKNLKLFLPIVFLLIICGVYFSYRGANSDSPKDILPTLVTNFEECIAAGNSATESYPRQCRDKDKAFVENVGNSVQKNDFIRLESPRPNQVISSPLIIKGEARGLWFFEASFPIVLMGEDGKVIAQGVAQAKSDSLTDNFIPFEATLNFVAGDIHSSKAILILRKDNPSGLPENDDALEVPVAVSKDVNPGTVCTQEVKLCPDGSYVGRGGSNCEFASCPETKSIKLYYYNSNLDKDKSGNISCSKNGLVTVERNIPITKTPIQDVINLLISGNLTNEERAKGITTEYPLSGLSLKGATLKDGLLKLEFDDPNNKTIGGSCRVSLLWLQIEETVKQFPEVQKVTFLPQEIFQP